LRKIIKILSLLFCIVFYNNIQAQCVGSQTASMSPVGPYSAGQVVTVTYTLSSFTQLNINWIIAFDIDYGVGWSSISPVSAPGNPGGSGGSWIWDTQNTYPSGLNFGPGYRFQNNGNANWGTSSTGPFTLSFQLVVGNSCTAEDLSIDLNVLGDCQTGGWNNGSCCTDPSYSVYTGNSIPTNNNISILDNTSDISCYGSSDGSISLNISSGISPFTYSWSNGFISASINNLSAGSYDVIVTDAAGCSAALNNIIINEPLEIQISSNTSPLSCYGYSDGSISLNISSGISPFTYSWSNGATTPSINNLSAGSYDVIVTDATGCTATLNVIINEPLEIQISSIISAISCYGYSDGSISLSISSGISPFTYSWSNGETTASINNLSAGSYDVIVTDATGCSAALNIFINQASTLVYVLNTNDATCFGSSDGNASIDLLASPTPTGTVSTLLYCSSNPSNFSQPGTIIEEVQLSGDNNSITNNSGGVNDFYEDYTASMYADITEGQSYTINVTLGDLSGTNSYLGGAKVFIDYNIDGDFNDPGEDVGIIPVQASAGILVPLSFTVPTTGAYGPTRMRVVCQSTYDFTTPNDIGPCESPVVGSWVNPWFGATEDYSIVLNNPSISATYLWSTGQNTDSIYGLSAGNYSVTITDDNGCLTIENFTISSATAITVSADFDQLLCEGIFPNPLSALGSTAGNNYSWTPASDFVNATNQNPVFSNAIGTTTSYMVTFTDFNGCVATDSVTITVFPTLTTDPINHN
jgi:phenolic acid decarboxylase